MTYEHEATIRERDITSREDVHVALAGGLGFPDHYGASLNALDDCLGDLSKPARVLVVRERGEDLPVADYLDKVCVCLMRAARENPALDVEVRLGERARSWREAFSGPEDIDPDDIDW